MHYIDKVDNELKLSDCGRGLAINFPMTENCIFFLFRHKFNFPAELEAFVSIESAGIYK